MKDLKTFITEGNLDAFALKFQQATKLQINVSQTYNSDEEIEDTVGLEFPQTEYEFKNKKINDYEIILVIDKNGNFVITCDSVAYIYNGTDWEYDDGYGDNDGISKLPNVNNPEDLKNYNMRSMNKLLKVIDGE